VRRTWRTDQLTAYRLVSDVVATAAYSAEVLGVVWDERVEEDLPSVGDRFTARNRMGGTRWTSTATVVEAEPGRRFAFAVGPVERPTAVWSFDLSAVDVPGAGTATTVEYTVVLGSGPSMFDTIRHLETDRYDAIVDERLDGLSASMANLLDALGACVDPHRCSTSFHWRTPQMRFEKTVRWSRPERGVRPPTDDHLAAEDGVDDPPDGVVGEAAVEGIDRVRGGVILDLVPGVDGGDPAGDQGGGTCRCRPERPGRRSRPR